MSDFHDTGLPGVNNGNISVNVTYLGSDIEIFVESNPGDFSEDELIEAVEKKDKQLPISRLLGYFKIKDRSNKLITEFNDYLQIKVIYSPLAWELAKNNGDPRVGHLARDGHEWAANWEEFKNKDGDVIVEVNAPNLNKPYGDVTIKVKSLPDPLIGNC